MSDQSPRIHLTTLGELRVTTGDEGDDPTLRPMVLSLLVYLAGDEVGRVHRRERLLGVFWPDVSDRRARQSLRRHLHLLRKALGDEAVRTPGREEVALDPSRISCDASEMEVAWRAGDHARCLELHGGEFAPGLRGPGAHAFEDWVHRRREELRRRALAAGEELVETALARGALDDAVRWAQRAARVDPLDERAARRVMELLHRAGDAAAALRRYDALHRLMWEELEVGPSPETVELAGEIRGEALDVAPRPTRPRPALRVRGPVGDPPVDRPLPAPGRGEGKSRSRGAAAVAAVGIVLAALALGLPRPGRGPAVATAASLEDLHTGDDDSLEDLLRAMDHYQRSVEERPGDPGAWAALARTGFTIGRAWPWRTEEMVRARAAVAELERLAPGGGLELWTRGVAALLDRRDYGAAADLLGRAAAALPGEPRILVALGQAHLNLGRPDRALDVFRRAAERGGLTPDLAQDQGHALSLLGRPEEARRMLDRARVLAPASGAIQHTAFRAALRVGDTVRLRQVTEGPLPHDGRFWVWGPGHAAYHRGDLSAADSLLSRATRTDHRHLGIVAHLRGDAVGAREHGDSLQVGAARALALAEGADPEALDPVSMAHAHARLAVASALRGRGPEARHHVGMARLLVPLDQEAQWGFPPVLLGMQAFMILGDAGAAAGLAASAMGRGLSRSWLEVDPLLRPILEGLPGG